MAVGDEVKTKEELLEELRGKLTVLSVAYAEAILIVDELRGIEMSIPIVWWECDDCGHVWKAPEEPAPEHCPNCDSEKIPHLHDGEPKPTRP